LKVRIDNPNHTRTLATASAPQPAPFRITIHGINDLNTFKYEGWYS